MEEVFVVARWMLHLTTCPGLRVTCPARSKTNANLNVGLERGIGSN